MGLLEPINTRITDPQYFLDSPQQGRTPSPVLPPVPFILVRLCHAPLLVSLQRQPSYRRLEGPTSSYKWYVKKRNASQRAHALQRGSMVGPEAFLTVVISAQDIFHWQIMDGNLTGNIRAFLPIVGESVPPSLCSFCIYAASFVLPLFHPFSPPTTPSGLRRSLGLASAPICPQGMCRWHRSRAGGTLAALES